MTTFGFSAFLKLANLSAVRQRSLIRDRVKGGKKGGYDFHKEMRSICRKHLVEGVSLEDCITAAKAIVQEPERNSAEAAIKKLAQWRRKFDGDVFALPNRTYETPRKVFKVRMDVDFGTYIGGQRIAVHLWNTKFPNLDSRLTCAAMALFPSLYSEEVQDFAVLSLRNAQLIRLSEATDASIIGANVVEALEEVFLDLRSGGTAKPGAEDRPSP